MLLYILSGIWIFLFLTTSYGVCRLWKNGLYNKNLIWDFVIRFTFPGLLLIGGIISILVSKEIYHMEQVFIYVVPAFFSGLAGSALFALLAMNVVAHPNRRLKKQKEKYLAAFKKARNELVILGRFPKTPSLIDGKPEEWREYTNAIEKLRAEGRLPFDPRGI